MKDKKKTESHEHIEVSTDRDQEYIVTMAYFKDHLGKQLWGSNAHMEMMDDDNDETEVVVSTYEIFAPDIQSAIRRAHDVDKARKMEGITGYVKVIEEKANEGHVDNDIRVASAFRDWMIKEGNFNEYFFTEPTSVMAVLKKNYKMAHDRTVDNVIANTEDIGDSIEDWLKDNDDKRNEDS
tara:strand:+ start:305 stop:847 length:543 start_codon:yes stop_codon:yes gene_type:complete